MFAGEFYFFQTGDFEIEIVSVISYLGPIWAFNLFRENVIFFILHFILIFIWIEGRKNIFQFLVDEIKDSSPILDIRLFICITNSDPDVRILTALNSMQTSNWFCWTCDLVLMISFCENITTGFTGFSNIPD